MFAKKLHHYVAIAKKHTITENTKYALRVANPRADNRLTGGWRPEGCIVMTLERPSDYYLFSICLIMASTYRSS
jgi:hypothetical protein